MMPLLKSGSPQADTLSLNEGECKVLGAEIRRDGVFGISSFQRIYEALVLASHERTPAAVYADHPQFDKEPEAGSLKLEE